MRRWPIDPACPNCGANLIRWTPPQGGRTERAAMWTATHVASAIFPGIIFLAVTAWVVINVVWRPFQPYPVIVYAVLSAALATVANLQFPLILIAQRRSAERDRLRDEEAFHVTIHTEEAIRQIEAKLDMILAQLNETTNDPVDTEPPSEASTTHHS